MQENSRRILPGPSTGPVSTSLRGSLSSAGAASKNEYLIARSLGFGDAVEYKHGAWYQKASIRSPADADKDAQIDLMYIREDSKIIICEVKYNDGSDLDRDTIYETQRKVDRFLWENPRYARYTMETALITTNPVPEAIRNERQ